MISVDIVREISQKLDESSVANLSLAVCDQSMVRERKRVEFDKTLRKRMQNFWQGRLCVLFRVFNSTGFWYEQHPHIFAISENVRHQFASSFAGWDVRVCGKNLHASTRVLDQVVSITVDLHCPHHSVRVGDDIRIVFDVVHTSIPLDLDDYKPTGEHTRILNAVYEALKFKSENQFGTYTLGGVQWTRYVTLDEMEDVFATTLGPEWAYVQDAEKYVRTRNGIKCNVKFLGRIEFVDDDLVSQIHLAPYGFIYRGPIPSTFRGFRGDMNRKMIKVLQPFQTFSFLYPVRMYQHFKIRIKLNDEHHTFASWNELRRLSGMSFDKLRSMSRRESSGVFIDFDAHTYKRKPISFDV